MQLVLGFVVFAAAAGLVLGDDCAPAPGEKHTHAGNCCKIPKFESPSMKTTMKTCMEKYPMQKSKGPPTPEMKNSRVCMAECFFTEEGLMDADNKPDQEAITEYFSKGDSELASVTSAAIETCFETYEDNVDSSLDCQSGAYELKKCLMRETFLNCPESMWTESEECEQLKEKVTRCPNMPVHLMGGPKGRRNKE